MVTIQNRFINKVTFDQFRVLMSHQNVISSMLAYTNVATIYENDVYMAYLPLAHVLELIAGL